MMIRSQRVFKIRAGVFEASVERFSGVRKMLDSKFCSFNECFISDYEHSLFLLDGSEVIEVIG